MNCGIKSEQTIKEVRVGKEENKYYLKIINYEGEEEKYYLNVGNEFQPDLKREIKIDASKWNNPVNHFQIRFNMSLDKSLLQVEVTYGIGSWSENYWLAYSTEEDLGSDSEKELCNWLQKSGEINSITIHRNTYTLHADGTHFSREGDFDTRNTYYLSDHYFIPGAAKFIKRVIGNYKKCWFDVVPKFGQEFELHGVGVRNVTYKGIVYLIDNDGDEFPIVLFNVMRLEEVENGE